jgi:F-type H+-transporting ATPase subunit b
MRVTFKRTGPVVMLLALASARARAEEQVHGLPQLDVGSFSSQLFWLAVFFLIVFLFMMLVAVPRLAGILDARRGKIDGDIGEAERLRALAAEAQKTYDATMAEARGRARRLLAEAEEQNAAQLAERTRAAHDEAERRIADAVRRIEGARLAAMRGIRAMAVDLVADITVKIVGRAPSAEVVSYAVDQAAGPEAA